jgi:hypothetical protein
MTYIYKWLTKTVYSPFGLKSLCIIMGIMSSSCWWPLQSRITAEQSTAQHSAAQRSTAQRSTARNSAAEQSRAQHSTEQHSTRRQIVNKSSIAQQRVWPSSSCSWRRQHHILLVRFQPALLVFDSPSVRESRHRTETHERETKHTTVSISMAPVQAQAQR